jgi:hypothetical protein
MAPSIDGSGGPDSLIAFARYAVPLPPTGYQALRKGRVSEFGQLYFVTKATQDRLPKDASAAQQLARGRLVQPGVPEILLGSLNWLQEHKLLALLAYCVMPDHLHLLFQLGEQAHLDNVMQRFGSFTGLRVYRHTGQGGLWSSAHLWQEAPPPTGLKEEKE